MSRRKPACNPTIPATALALVLALAACASPDARPPDTRSLQAGPDVLLRVADDTRSGGDPGTAVGLYRQLHERQPNDPVPLLRLGSTLLQIQAYTEAADAFRAALVIAPGDPEAHRGLATVLLALSQPQGAIAELELALAVRSDDPRIHNALGVGHDMIGRQDLAQRDYLEGLRIAPTNASLRNNYALSLALSGDYAGAISSLGGLAARPDAPPRYRLNLALVHGLAGDQDKAAAQARLVLDEAAVQNNLAYYALLRAMDGKARAAAIIGAELHGSALRNPLAVSEAPRPVPPPMPVEAEPLTPPPARAARPISSDAAQANPPGATRLAAAPHPIIAKPTAPKPVAAPPPPAAGQPAPAAAAVPPAAVAEPVAAKEAMPAAPMPADKAAPSETAPAAPLTAAAEPPAAAETGPPAAAPPTETAKPAEAPSAIEPAPAASSPSATAAAEPPAAPAASSAAPTIPPATPASAKAVAAASRDHYSVQFGSFATDTNARQLADELGKLGIAAGIVRSRDREGREWFTVRSGDFPNAIEATAAAHQMADAAGARPAVIVHARGPV